MTFKWKTRRKLTKKQKALCCVHSPQRSSHQINHNLRNKKNKSKPSSSVHTVWDLWFKTHTALFLPHQKQQPKELKKASKYKKNYLHAHHQILTLLNCANPSGDAMAKWTQIPLCIMTSGDAMAKLATLPLCIMTSGDTTAKWTTNPLCIMTSGAATAKGTTNPLCIMTSGDATAKWTTNPLCIMTSGDATAKWTTNPLHYGKWRCHGKTNHNPSLHYDKY